MQFGPVDPPAAAWLAAEKDIFRHAQFVDERELLRDHGDPGGLRVPDAVERGRLAGDAQLAFVTTVRMDAGQQLDQRGFTRAVFAAKCMDLAGAQVEVYVVQRDDTGKFFRQAPRFEQRPVE